MEWDVIGLLEIAFETQRIRRICLDEEVAEKRLGSDLAASLIKRIADLRASDTILDVIAGNPREIGNGKYGISLTGGWTLILLANHVPQRTLESGKIDWSKTKRVKILGWEVLDE